MRPLSRTTALERLAALRENFRTHTAGTYEHRAKSCDTCETKGACCLDAHFVNVRVSRLEAEAMTNAISDLKFEIRNRVFERTEQAIENYTLDDMANTSHATYACPLFEKNVGCLVHKTAKPFACIAHACYEREEDLPPGQLLTEQEGLVEELNVRTYGRSQPSLPIPLAIKRVVT